MIQLELRNIQTVNFDRSRFDLNDSAYGQTNGTFAGSSPSNDSYFLATFNFKTETAEYLIGIWSIPKSHVIEFYVSVIWPLNIFIHG